MTPEAAPLSGINVVELAGIGPAPFASAILADLGATVVRMERPSEGPGAVSELDRLGVRGCLIVEADLKSEPGMHIAASLLGAADVVIEAYRPGVSERLGVGPDDIEAMNPGVVYARITGWGQTGPYAMVAGHDINYLAVTGALAATGHDRPVAPLNLLADYAGGSLYAVIGILASLFRRERTGGGALLDVAMVDGVASLLAPFHRLRGVGLWRDERSSNILDGRAPFYRTYRTSDDRFVAVGALEPAFYALMVDGLELDSAELPIREDQRNWDALAQVFEGVFAARTRDHWAEVFSGTDACVTPVLSLEEATKDPHAVERDAFEFKTHMPAPSAAPRMSGVHPRTHAERFVSDTLVALGLDVELAGELERAGASYWV